MTGIMLSDHELLYTMRGRRHLEWWCERTPFEGNAATLRKRLEEARKKVPDEECPET